MAVNKRKKEKGRKGANDLIPFLRDALNRDSDPYVNLHWEEKLEMKFSFRRKKDATNCKDESKIYIAYNRMKGFKELDGYDVKQKLISAMDSSNYLKKIKQSTRNKVVVYQFVKYDSTEKADEDYLNSFKSSTNENSCADETDSVTDNETEMDSNQLEVTTMGLRILHKFLHNLQCYLHNCNFCGMFTDADARMHWESNSEMISQRKELFKAFSDFKQYMCSYKSQVLNQDEIDNYRNRCRNCERILEILHGVQSDQHRKRKRACDANKNNKKRFRKQQNCSTARDKHDDTRMISDDRVPSSSTLEKNVSEGPCAQAVNNDTLTRMVSDDPVKPSSSTLEKNVSEGPYAKAVNNDSTTSVGLKRIDSSGTIRHCPNSIIIQNANFSPGSYIIDTATAARMVSNDCVKPSSSTLEKNVSEDLCPQAVNNDTLSWAIQNARLTPRNGSYFDDDCNLRRPSSIDCGTTDAAGNAQPTPQFSGPPDNQGEGSAVFNNGAQNFNRNAIETLSDAAGNPRPAPHFNHPYDNQDQGGAIFNNGAQTSNPNTVQQLSDAAGNPPPTPQFNHLYDNLGEGGAIFYNEAQNSYLNTIGTGIVDERPITVAFIALESTLAVTAYIRDMKRTGKISEDYKVLGRIHDQKLYKSPKLKSIVQGDSE